VRTLADCSWAEYQVVLRVRKSHFSLDKYTVPLKLPDFAVAMDAHG
jgi:hypothetical protein